MRLFIAEKPAMGLDIAKNIGQQITRHDGYVEVNGDIVTWCIGHLLELCNPEDYDEKFKQWKLEDLPIFPEKWKYKVSDGKGKQVNTIKSLIPKADLIVNAGDPGREGQLIIDELLVFLNNKKPVKRILLPSLDKKTVQRELNNLRDNNDFKNLYMAGVARAECDWLVGLNTSRSYSIIGRNAGYGGVLTVGRVQSPTLKIVVDRDLEIENFIPKDYYSFQAEFSLNNHKFLGRWTRKPNTEYQFLDEDGRIVQLKPIEDIANRIKNKLGVVTLADTKKGSESAPMPFSLSALTVLASAKWGYTGKEVLDTCQSLYEKKATSYPRTDCQYLPENLHTEAQDILNAIKNANPSLQQLVANANTKLKHHCFNDTKLSDHYGIIPTSEAPDISSLSQQEKNIYETVCKRFIGIFYPDCIFEKTSISIEIEQELFKSYGKTIIDPGFKVVFSDPQNKDDEDEENQDLPKINTGDKPLCTNTIIEKKQTTPPSRFTDGTLTEAMIEIHRLAKDPEVKKKLKELKGIGREATRSVIIDNLVRRNFLTRDKKYIVSTEVGRALIKVLTGKITDPAITAMWENALDGIAEGKISFDSFMSKQRDWVVRLLDESKKIDASVFSNLSKIQPKQTGKSKSYNKSQYTKSAQPKPTGKKCPKCGSDMLERKSKTGNKFYGCKGFPQCKHIENFK